MSKSKHPFGGAERIAGGKNGGIQQGWAKGERIESNCSSGGDETKGDHDLGGPTTALFG